jgi:hypothetical protein
MSLGSPALRQQMLFKRFTCAGVRSRRAPWSRGSSQRRGGFGGIRTAQDMKSRTNMMAGVQASTKDKTDSSPGPSLVISQGYPEKGMTMVAPRWKRDSNLCQKTMSRKVSTWPRVNSVSGFSVKARCLSSYQLSPSTDPWTSRCYQCLFRVR